MKIFSSSLLALSLLASTATVPAFAQTTTPQLELVAPLDIRPGNVAVSKNGRVFTSIHPFASTTLQLAEIKDGKAVAFPSEELQRGEKKSPDATFDTVLGTFFDKNDRLWVIDMGLNLGRTRIWAFDIATGKTVEKIELPADIAPAGSFMQDLRIDETNGWAYLADIANPGIIAVSLKTKEARRFSGHASLQPENVDMVIDGKVTNFNGAPARVGINPITLSDDRETLFFGAMSGVNWYCVPTALFREGKDADTIGAAIKRVAAKPVSDGAVTDTKGNHYFGDVGANAIVKVSSDGATTTTLIQDPRIMFPDNLSLAADNWVYVSINQLNTSAPFTGAGDQGKPPYGIYRFKQN